MYNQKVINIFQNPLNAGLLRGANGKGRAESEHNTDIVEIYVLIENNKFEEIKFKAFGGVSTIVCASIVTELVRNKSVKAINNLTEKDVLEVIDNLPEDKIYSISLAINAVKNAVEDYNIRIEKEKEKEEKAKKAN